MIAEDLTPTACAQYWLWVARPEYYLDKDGSDREDLDPSSSEDLGGWWTCHRNTRKGDLVLLWRTRPRSDVGYLIQTGTDAYSIADDPYAAESGWDYGCEYLPLFKFRKPLTVAEVRADPYLQDWSALRGRFQNRAFAIPPEIWHHLVRRLATFNPGFPELLRRLAKSPIAPTQFLLEEDLENHLVDNLGVLSRHGYDLELLGRQVICTGHGGRIDLLCFDRRAKRNVVIELKSVRAGQNTIGQVTTYMGWVNQHHAHPRPALGLVIARGFDNRFLSAASTTRLVKYLTLEELDLG